MGNIINFHLYYILSSKNLTTSRNLGNLMKLQIALYLGPRYLKAPSTRTPQGMDGTLTLIFAKLEIT